MKIPKFAWLAAFLLAAAVPASAQTYNYVFTGTVTSASGVFAGDSGTVTGTLTFDYSNNLTGTGTVGSPSGWLTLAQSGSYFDLPQEPAVFASTLSYGATQIYSSIVTPLYNSSNIQGVFNGGTNNYFEATEQSNVVAGTGYASYVDIGDGAQPWTSAGQPVLAGTSYPYGYVSQDIQNSSSTLFYKFTALTPVSPTPLPPSIWMLLGGLAGFALFGHARGRGVRVGRRP